MKKSRPLSCLEAMLSVELKPGTNLLSVTTGTGTDLNKVH